jgi:hypothetical protein
MGNLNVDLLIKNITWADGTQELIRLGKNGLFILDGVGKRLVGFHDRLWFASGNFWDASNLAILDKEYTYLQSKGVRIIHIEFPYWYGILSHYASALQIAYNHKMLAVPLIPLKYLRYYNLPDVTDYFNISNGPDFNIKGEMASVSIANWTSAMIAYPNVVTLCFENELDYPLSGQSYTASNAVAYMQMARGIIQAKTNLPIITKLCSYDPLRQAMEDALIPYSVIPAHDIYQANAGDYTSILTATKAWYTAKQRDQLMWLMEMGAPSGDAPNIASMTKPVVDAALAFAGCCFFWAMNNQSGDGDYFDSAGNPKANTDTLLANIPTWQAAI